MKKLILGGLLLVSLIQNTAIAQTWSVALTVPAAGSRFKNVYFTDAMHGWAVGSSNSSGIVYATTDGGTTWNQQAVNSFYYVDLFDVFFIDNQTGWVVGESGNIYKTTNGGTTWTNLATIPNSPELQKVNFTSLTNGYVLGTNNIYSTTTDGGTTWTNGGSISDTKLDCLFTSSQIGIACGTNQISRTTDGGTSWSHTTSTTTFRGIDSTSANNLWIVGDAGYITSSDQGANWSSINTFSSGGGGTDIRFLNSNIGWVTQSGSSIIKTVNGGSTWTNDFTTSNTYFSGIYPINENNVFVTGYKQDESEAYIYRYSCAGVTAPQALNGFSGLVTSPCEGTSFTYTANTFIANPEQFTYSWTFPADWTITSPTSNSNIITGTYGATSGPITVFPTNTCGLSSVPTIINNITVELTSVPEPTFINLISNNNCIGGNNNFQTTAAPYGTEWVWSSNNWDFVAANATTVNPFGTFITDESNATVSVYLQNACGGVSSTFTETFSLNLDTQLPVPTIAANGSTLTTAAVANEYCWFLLDNTFEFDSDTCFIGTAGMTYTPNVSGVYGLVISTVNGCQTTSDTLNFVVPGTTTGISINEKTSLEIYPNPTNGLVTISALQTGSTLQLVDASGRVLRTEILLTEQTTLDLSENNSGVYFVSIIGTDGSSTTKKLIVRK